MIYVYGDLERLAMLHRNLGPIEVAAFAAHMYGASKTAIINSTTISPKSRRTSDNCVPIRTWNKRGSSMKTVALIAGVIGVLLGGLWLLQGLGIVHVRPILCFANCTPIQGPSSTWAIVGITVLAAGVRAIFYSRKSRSGDNGRMSN